MAKMEARAIILLDVRPRDEYEAGHLAGAISVPMEELELYLQNLPKARPSGGLLQRPLLHQFDRDRCQVAAEGITAYKLEGER